MTDQLSLYNLALGAIGERKLSSLTENREPRRVLDDNYTNITGYCLAQGMWNFAMKNASLDLVTGLGGFGFARKFQLPSDLIHIFSAADNAGFNPQIDRDFFVHAGHFYAASDTVYMRYTSNDADDGGMNLGGWTEGFTAYVAVALARASCMRIIGSLDVMAMLEAREDEAYMASFTVDCAVLPQGPLPFNAVARNPSGADPIQGGELLMPFSAYRKASARFGQYGQAQQQQRR